MSQPPVYLDHNATTPVDDRVLAAMTPYFGEHFGNPSSAHAYGQRAHEAVERARGQVAACVGARPAGIVFTSGGTEANNHAIAGAVARAGTDGTHVVTTAVEHPAVLEVCRDLESRGVATTLVPVDAGGRVDPDAVEAAFTDATCLVTVMHANNEVGTLQPVTEVAARARARGILSHSDCAQSAGKVPVDLDDLDVDMISLAGHKLYAPKGVGALCLRAGVTLPNLLHGAGHEGGRRPGTENVPGLVGLGEACVLAAEGLSDEMERLREMRDRLEQGLLAAVPTARVHGASAARLPNTLSIGFPGRTAAEILAAAADDVAASAGAACHGDGTVGSHVLAAMGVDAGLARGTVRLTLGRKTTMTAIERAMTAIVQAVSS